MTVGNYLVYGEPITGWMLLRCLHDDDKYGVRMGQWIMAYAKFVRQRNKVKNPSFIFDELPFDNDFEDADGIRALLKRAKSFEQSLTTDPQTGYGFYHCCLSDGFDPFKDEFYTWVAERMTELVIKTQCTMPPAELKMLLDMLVELEEYEKAALVRDALEGKTTKRSGIF